MYRLGQVVGQPIGGFLAHPERQWPKVFSGKFWAKYPFSLPCFVGAGFALSAVAYAAIVLEEVRISRQPQSPCILHDSSRPFPPEGIATIHRIL